ncbi:MAG TPA: ROK family protein [Gemmatimonadales bacterium]|nr:ROK family protein [Gemmatimonadota bacterium]MCB9519045.1 ROK family protein [Gemmatimonadales bacterium]HPF61172.1 ROK family protein [Gemmatimonadales bacterium]HRX19632.1 ROK family protein [Gemmatimonadales bacterium]
MNWVLGIDIGGTNLVVGAVAIDGSRVVGNHSRPTDASRGPDAIVDDLVAMASHARDQLAREVPGAALEGVGIGAPGPLDTKTGIIALTPNLGWVNMPLRARLGERLDLPAALDNDANCAVLGEAWVGAAREARYVLGVTIGTGIGGGIVLDRRLHHGASDCAGEIGHITIDMDGRRCGCGNYGCLEAYASGPAIAMRAREQIRSGAESRLADLVGGDLEAVTAQTVYEAASIGDDLARDVVRATAQYLGTGIANLLNVFNPDLVVVMGGVTQAGDGLFEPLRRVVAQRAFKPAVDACRIVPGTLSGLAGVYGAARMFLDQRDAA